MKKIVLALAVVAAMAASGAIYPQALEVVNIDRAADVVVLETASGFAYELEGAEDYAVGDVVAAIMWNSGTENIADDEIIVAQYTGFYK